MAHAWHGALHIIRIPDQIRLPPACAMDDASQAAQERCCVWLWQGVFCRIYDTLLEDNIITVDQVSSFYHVCISHCQTVIMGCFREWNGLLMRTDNKDFDALLCVAH